MNRRWLIVLLMLGITIVGLSACYSETGSNSPSILLRELPQDLATRIAAQQADLARSLSSTAATANEIAHTNGVSAGSTSTDGVRQTILDLNLKKPATIKALSDKMKEVGPVALIGLDDLLTTQDDATREKAAFALRCLVNRGENGSGEATQADRLIALLLRRAVFDRSTKMRESAITGLSALGFSKRTGVMEDVIAGLTDAQEDPDQRNSSRAKDSMQTITSYTQGQ